MADQIFVNLPVKDLKKTKEFFAALGFTYNPQFTDDKAACMIIGEKMYAMLLQEKFFEGFLRKKKISDAKKTTEVLLAIHLESREAVDTMVEKAVTAGGKQAREAEDHGWMYARPFEDLDGHIWEPFHVDESKIPEKP